MAEELVKELIDAGVHFGHRASRWNPKMKPYIFGKRNLIHILDIRETLRGLLLAKKFVEKVVSDGKDVLFVGTKRQAREAIEDCARETNMHFVTERWLGGMLTNFREIRKRVGRLEELERLEAEGMLDTYSKKQGASLRRELRKIQRNLDGIRSMTSQPGVLVVVDQRREIIAVREARKMGIPVICLLDTDSDPDLVDIPIPGNDDAMRAITIVMREVHKAIANGVGARTKRVDQDGQAPRRRSKRPAMGQAEEASAADVAPVAEEAPAAAPAAEPVAEALAPAAEAKPEETAG